MTINIEALDRAIEYAEAHPEEYDQAFWFRSGDCGTTACIAGTIAMQEGWRPIGWFIDGTTRLVRRGEEESAVSRVAGEILGIDRETRSMLFLGAGDLNDVKRIRDQLAAGEPVCLCGDGPGECSGHL